MHGLFIDGFAGSGGASTGIAQAIGREVDIAINHSPSAIAIHKANHPATEHHCQDIRALWPAHATRLRPVAGAWFSPDCKEFSKAKGAPVKNRHIRALANEVTVWLKETRPTVAYLENVEEFETAAPLDAEGIPIKGMEGKMFKALVRQWRALGYRVQWRVLKACNYGAPTSRKRLYVVMRCDGLPIVWPKPTHGPANDNQVISGKLLPYRTAAECIDWSIPCPSIFDRKKDLAEATNQRLAHGVVRHVINAAKAGNAFIVPVTHQGSVRVHDLNDPLRTVTGAHRGELALGQVEISPFISYGQQGGLNRPANDPLHTIAASSKDTNGVASAFLTRFYGSDKKGAGGELDRPLGTARAGGQHHAVVAAHMAQFNTNPNGSVNVGHGINDLVSTIATRGPHQGVVETTMVEASDLPPAILERATLVAAFLVKYYGEGGTSQSAGVPLDCITTKARFAVVTVTIDAVTYVIVDIGLRMLKPRELARAQGFPDSYILDPLVRKFLRGKWVERRLTIAEQISAIGNSVCPPVARALVAANQPRPIEERLAA
ncbi:DNA cytosine methyltransferase [Sphingomonas abietis]|uniref:DNA (cytosine-5-)-methyltransferase n=1 Tax=Sphingomonas abietis TaxID=3012344 RepID=A0ABY7NTH0_9SPHN|nr:DNA cytosine methyltransferase [Sphingomonas abietis]WBO23953.1 DNA cytosine methyltransferase [Sphingomonas abietis]